MWKLAPIAALLAVLSGSEANAAESVARGIQLTPDQDFALVSKDVDVPEGTQRWAIALNPRTGIALGNVFFVAGGDPTFVWCQSTKIELDADPAKTRYTLDCYGAPRCATQPCGGSQWGLVATGIELEGSFFYSP